MTAGMGVGIGVMALAAEGLITGSEPHNANEAHLWRMSGKQAYSIRVGDHWVPYRKWLGWYGPVISLAANMYQVGGTLDHEGLSAGATAVLFGLSEVVADESWARGVSDMVEAIKSEGSGGKKAAQYVRNLASNFVPFSVGQSQIAHLLDPYMRRANGFIEQVQAKTPFLSESLTVRRDIFGEPLASHMIVTPTRVNDDPSIKAMQAANIWPREVDRKIRGVELTPQQLDDYARIAGRKFKMNLDGFVHSPEYAAMPGHLRRDMIQDMLTQDREAARQTVIAASAGTSNDILVKARAKKEADRAEFDSR